MRGRWRALFAGSVVASVVVYLLLAARPAFAAGTNLSEASPASAAVATVLGQVEQTCDDVDEATGQEACQEATESEEESQPAEDTCEGLDDQTEQETCDEAESTTRQSGQEETTRQAGQEDETTGLNVNNNQTTNNRTNSEPTNRDPNANDQGQTDQPAESRNEHTQSAKKSNTESKTDGPLARLGRWVVHVTDRLGNFIGGVVGRVSDLVGGEDGTSGSSNPKDKSQAAAGNDRSGESSAANARGSGVGDPPPPWWEAWLPTTGPRWLLPAVIVSLVLIASGVALRSVRRRRRFHRGDHAVVGDS
jgi:hypothetical protein